jgi:hypothetical protein
MRVGIEANVFTERTGFSSEKRLVTLRKKIRFCANVCQAVGVTFIRQMLGLDQDGDFRWLVQSRRMRW